MARPRAPFGGQTLIADKSAWSRADHPSVRSQWSAALRNGQIATCPIVNLELLYSARDAEALAEVVYGVEDCVLILQLYHAVTREDTLNADHELRPFAFVVKIINHQKASAFKELAEARGLRFTENPVADTDGIKPRPVEHIVAIDVDNLFD